MVAGVLGFSLQHIGRDLLEANGGVFVCKGLAVDISQVLVGEGVYDFLHACGVDWHLQRVVYKKAPSSPRGVFHVEVAEGKCREKWKVIAWAQIERCIPIGGGLLGSKKVTPRGN